MRYFINYIFYLVQDHSQGESEPGNQFYFTPNSLNLFGIKMKGRWGGKAATDRVDKEGEIGQRAAKAYHMYRSFYSPLLLPPSPSDLSSPGTWSKEDSKAHRPLQPSWFGDSEKVLQISVHCLQLGYFPLAILGLVSNYALNLLTLPWEPRSIPGEEISGNSLGRNWLPLNARRRH